MCPTTAAAVSAAFDLIAQANSVTTLSLDEMERLVLEHLAQVAPAADPCGEPCSCDEPATPSPKFEASVKMALKKLERLGWVHKNALGEDGVHAFVVELGGELCKEPAAVEKPADFPPAYNGCNCACHRTPGMVHSFACCGPELCYQPPAEKPAAEAGALLPCAHCGGPAAFALNDNDWWDAECRSCCCQTAMYGTQEEAAEHWNTRAPRASLADDPALVLRAIQAYAKAAFPDGPPLSGNEHRDHIAGIQAALRAAEGKA